jgi:glycerophosphoryl diester phosphodiesterase
MKLIAHRGASREAPENTIPAIHLAWQEKADGVEIDVRLTSDGKVVLMHDENVLRTAGKNLEVAYQPWDALRVLDAGVWMSPRWKGTQIPLLRDVLKMLPGGRTLWIEVKSGTDIIPALKADIEVRKPPMDAIKFLGFSAHVMGELKKVFPKHGVYLNVEPRGFPNAPNPWAADLLVAQARRSHLDGLSVGLSDAVDEAFIKTVHDSGLDLTGWVADDEHVALRLARAGLRSVMTNRPAYIRHRLRDHGVS